jgi:TRAP-type transport system periplasmic protein
MMPSARNRSLLASAVALAVALGTGAALAQTAAKFGHTAATASVSGQVALEFAERVNARAPSLRIEVFGDSALGGTQTLVEGVQLGTVHMSNAGYGTLGAFVSEFGALELPFIFGRDLDMGRILAVTSSELYEEWQAMLAQQIGVRVVAPAWYYGHRDILVKRPATTPGDLAGQKIRVVPAPLYVEIMRALGAVPTPVDWPEVYSALRQGLIDGVDAATDSMTYMKFYEAATHYLPTRHITGLNAMIANQRWYDSLAEADRQVLDEELVWFQKEIAERLFSATPAVLEELEAHGVTLHDIDLDAFHKAVEEHDVARRVAEAQNWRPGVLDRFRDTLVAAGFTPTF